ncbi:transketolase [Hydrogenispora ethanolica]|jgi:transketolase|uniref:Transketolase n=2 Tax=Hydrogenispora ethanolica TaxID=1082276 RepID=A0A4R1R818_HYDET|nr:transketolase [Hydrogenispora ethanolica]
MEQEKMLQEKAAAIRMAIVKMIGPNQVGHFGGSLSVTDILAVLYFHKMTYDATDPSLPGRDRLILSKAHAAPAQYATLALAGFFPLQELQSLKKLGSRLQGHPDFRRLPGIEANTGSLGQGLSMGVGMALAKRLKKEAGRVYVILGDGELQEGQVWEAAMAAANYKLDRLTAIVDHNKLQATDAIAKRMQLGDLRSKWSSFGWEVIEADGHDVHELCAALDKAESNSGCPSVMIAHTTKGKGISFMENVPKYHNGMMSQDQYEQALRELQA